MVVVETSGLIRHGNHRATPACTGVSAYPRRNAQQLSAALVTVTAAMTHGTTQRLNPATPASSQSTSDKSIATAKHQDCQRAHRVTSLRAHARWDSETASTVQHRPMAPAPSTIYPDVINRPPIEDMASENTGTPQPVPTVSHLRGPLRGAFAGFRGFGLTAGIRPFSSIVCVIVSPRKNHQTQARHTARPKRGTRRP